MLIPLVTAAAINVDYIICKLLVHDTFQEQHGTFEEQAAKQKKFLEERRELLPEHRQKMVNHLLNKGLTKEDLMEKGFSGKTKLAMLEDLEYNFARLNDFVDNQDYITYNNRFRKRPTWEDGVGTGGDQIATDGESEDGKDGNKDNNNADNNGNNGDDGSNVPGSPGSNQSGGDDGSGGGIPGFSASFNPFKSHLELIIDASFQAATQVPVPNFLLPMVAGTFSLSGGFLPFLVGGAVSQYFAPCIAPGLTGLMGTPVIAVNTALTTMAMGGSLQAAGAASPGLIPYEKFCDGLFQQAKAIQWMVTEIVPGVGPMVVTSMLQ